jgi:uncharacterized protein involved in outer membrane biogenesis
MRRTSKIIAISLASVAAVLVLLVILVINFDWNRARPWINQQVSEASGRHFAIQGDLRVSWQKPSANAELPHSFWAGWLPWPQVSANDIVLGNPQ